MMIAKLKFCAIVSTLLFCLACQSNTLLNDHLSVPNQQWSYDQQLNSELKVNDTLGHYNAYLNLRINNNYRYANLYVLLRFQQPNSSKQLRYQFKLAAADGRWLGKGSSDIYSFQFPLFTNYRFTDTGTYRISIEQNMRDNPLVGVSDVGLVVKKQ